MKYRSGSDASKNPPHRTRTERELTPEEKQRRAALRAAKQAQEENLQDSDRTGEKPAGASKQTHGESIHASGQPGGSLHDSKQMRNKNAQTPSRTNEKTVNALKQAKKNTAASKQKREEEQTLRSMKNEAQEKDRLRRERRKRAAKKRKQQLILRTVLVLAAAAFLIVGLVLGVKAVRRKKLEPESGAGTNILQAAEDAVSGRTADSGTSVEPSGDQAAVSDPIPSEEGNTPAEQDVSLQPTEVEVNGNDRVTLCMVGDVILHQRILDASVSGGGWNFDNLFANVTSEVQKYDIRIANQETILGGDSLECSGYPVFNSPFEEADALVNAGFNVVLHATNHALDKGQPGVQNCLRYWNNTYPDTAVLGIHDETEPSRDFYIYEKNNIRVAVLNYTYGTNQYQEEVLSGLLSEEVSFMTAGRVYSEIRQAREMADYVVVCPHWGDEDVFEITTEQRDWAQYFLEWGVDLVIGTHPHVIQPIRTLTRNDGHTMLVYYSIGNFLSNQEERCGNVGAMAQVIIEKDSEGKAFTAGYGARPVVCHESYDGEAFTTYFLDEYPENLAEVNDVKATDPEFSYSYCKELPGQIFGDVGKLTLQ